MILVQISITTLGKVVHYSIKRRQFCEYAVIILILANMLYMWFVTGYYYILIDTEPLVHKPKAIFEIAFIELLMQMSNLLQPIGTFLFTLLYLRSCFQTKIPLKSCLIQFSMVIVTLVTYTLYVSFCAVYALHLATEKTDKLRAKHLFYVGTTILKVAGYWLSFLNLCSAIFLILVIRFVIQLARDINSQNNAMAFKQRVINKVAVNQQVCFFHIIFVLLESSLSVPILNGLFHNPLPYYRDETAWYFFMGVLDIFLCCMIWFFISDTQQPTIVVDPNTKTTYFVHDLIVE